MTFGIKEISRLFGKKVNLYLFRYGESVGSYYAFTDHTQSITNGGFTYLPIPISRGSIVAKGNMDKSTIEVRMPLNQDISELFRIYPPASVVSLTIKQGHLSDPDSQFLVVWAGRVASAKREPPELILSCEPIRSSLKRVGLRRHYQYSCPHVLYSPQCGANKVSARSIATVASIAGNVVTLVDGWTSRTRTDFVSGLVEWLNDNGDVETRMIMRAEGNVLTLSATARQLAVSDSVSVYLGCKRTMDGCSMHSNILNFGGCPFIPTKTPVGRTSLYD